MTIHTCTIFDFLSQTENNIDYVNMCYNSENAERRAVFSEVYPLLYFPQMCNMKTDAINNNDMTRTGTGPLQRKKKYIISSIFVKNAVMSDWSLFCWL